MPNATLWIICEIKDGSVVTLEQLRQSKVNDNLFQKTIFAASVALPILVEENHYAPCEHFYYQSFNPVKNEMGESEICHCRVRKDSGDF